MHGKLLASAALLGLTAGGAFAQAPPPAGLAQEAMERAETRLLTRATTPDAIDQPDNSPPVAGIFEARQALGYGNIPKAEQQVTQVLVMGGPGGGL